MPGFVQVGEGGGMIGVEVAGPVLAVLALLLTAGGAVVCWRRVGRRAAERDADLRRCNPGLVRARELAGRAAEDDDRLPPGTWCGMCQPTPVDHLQRGLRPTICPHCMPRFGPARRR